METKLTKSQTRLFGPVPVAGYGKGAVLTATVRYNDECGNGHNTFSVTADVVTPASKRRGDIEAGGCLHEDIARAFPELAPLIRWHLCSSDGPMHYVANTLYWLGRSGWTDGKPGAPPNLEHARSSAAWPEMPESYLSPVLSNADVTAALEARLPALLEEFRAAVLSLGFVW